MAKKTDTETRTVLRKLIVFVLLFYSGYYVTSIVLVGAFAAGWEELGRYPFRHKLLEFSPSSGHGVYNGPALGAWLAMVVAYIITLPISFWVVAATRRAWDYLATVSLLHLSLTCAVTHAFPTNWVWWVTLLLCTALSAGAAEVAIYRLKDLREIQLDH